MFLFVIFGFFYCCQLAVCCTTTPKARPLPAPYVCKQSDAVPYSASEQPSPEDFVFPEKLRSPDWLTYPTSLLKYKFVASQGRIYGASVRMPKAALSLVEVAATEKVTEKAHRKTAEIVARMTMHMPALLFNNLARYGATGVFTWEDKLTSFPEFAELRDVKECKGNCHGNCNRTCTRDKKHKWEALPGLAGPRATAVDGNIMCTDSDPYKGNLSLLVHELAHTIHLTALTERLIQQINASYHQARTHKTWDTNSLTMHNVYEYWAKASAAFFAVDKIDWRKFGMNSWGFCDVEADARSWLKNKDFFLHALLSYVYTDNRPHLSSGLKICL